MQDTFSSNRSRYFARTHTSSVQVRYMEKNQPPIRTISPGRVLGMRLSQLRHIVFFTGRGFVYWQKCSFADLKQTLLYFTKALFGKSKIRLRPSYFPLLTQCRSWYFWGLETEIDYRITKGTGWLEIMGCGIVDPNVLKNCKMIQRNILVMLLGWALKELQCCYTKLKIFVCFWKRCSFSFPIPIGNYPIFWLVF